MKWTTEQVMALAPDPASGKAAQGLANAHKWLTVGSHEPAIWGECQGSGKDPYRTQINLSEPAFRCTCPSRKFPCKHGLGLLLLFAHQPGAFTPGAPPAWVSEWLESRVKRAQQRVEKQLSSDQQEKKVPDGRAQAKRVADREARVAAAIDELELWLRDLIRGGLAAAQNQPPSFWERASARLIDAQAPGLARLIADLAGIPAAGDDWQSRWLERLSRIHLAVEGFKRINELSPETQADLRSIIGWTQNQEELLSQPGVRDYWHIIGRRIEDEDRLRVQRTWLRGETNHRTAMILQFAHGQQPLDTGLIPGTRIEAELVFYPGAYPLRALVKQRFSEPESFDTFGGNEVADVLAAYAAALAQNPWLELSPFLLAGVVPVHRDDDWWLRDAVGNLLPLHPHFKQQWELLALSGGDQLSLFGEWDGDYLWPLSAAFDHRSFYFG